MFSSDSLLVLSLCFVSALIDPDPDTESLIASLKGRGDRSRDIAHSPFRSPQEVLFKF